MKQIFVETSWVVEYGLPPHMQRPDAIQLLQRARQGEVALYIPAICIAEAYRPIREKAQSRFEANRVRQYLKWAIENKSADPDDDARVRRILDQMESSTGIHMNRLEDVLGNVAKERGVTVFPLSEEMLHRSVVLSQSDIGLEPFDLSIVSAVTVCAAERTQEGAVELAFCTLDRDLQPNDRQGRPKSALKQLYDASLVWVYNDFTLQLPARPENWPGVSKGHSS